MWPPCLFALIWAIEMLIIPVSGYFHVSLECQFFYLLGVLAFSAGGYAAMWLPAPSSSQRLKESPTILKLFVIADVILAFLFAREVVQLVKTVADSNFFFAARVAFLDQPDTTFVDNAVPFAMILATIFVLRDDGSRRAKFATFSTAGLAFILNLLTGGRAGAVELALMLLAIAWFKKRLTWKYLSIVGLISATLFFFIALTVGKGLNRNGSFSDNGPLLLDSVLTYAITGPITFDQVYHSPTVVPAVWHPDRVFVQVANKLGARLEQPELHAEYSNFAPTKITNIYTMYFAYYPHYGYFLTLVVTAFLGFICVLIHRKARTGAPWAILVSATLFSGVILSPYNEGFFMDLNYIAKVMLLCWVVYRNESSRPLLSRWTWRKPEFNKA